MNKFLLLLIVPLFFFDSCINDNMVFDIGKDRVDVKTHMIYVDSVSAKSFTVKFDSVATSGLEQPSILVGKYNDNEFGTVSSSSFFRFKTISVNGSTIPDNAVFDSIRIFLQYNNYWVGDTMAPFKLNLYRLKGKLDPQDDNFYYNTDSIATYSNTIGTATFMPRPISHRDSRGKKSDTIWVKLDQNFGQELFNLVENNDDIIKEADRFTNYLQGFMLHYDVTNQAILGFSFPSITYTNMDTVSPRMRLYYHHTEQTVRYKKLDFSIEQYEKTNYSNKLQFNKIELTNPKFILPATQKDKVPAYLTNHKTYTMAGVGIMTRIEFPYLKNLLTLYENIHIVDAVLEIEPARNSYITMDLPKNLSLFETDKFNNIGAQIKNKYGQVQTPVFNLDELYQEDTYYRFDVTQFLQDQLLLLTDQTPALLMTISGDNYYSTLQRLVSGSSSNSRDRVKLKIYYITIE